MKADKDDLKGGLKEDMKGMAVQAAVQLLSKTPEMISSIKRKKEDESTFFEKNKSWIFAIILAIFVTNLNYITMFDGLILNSLANIIYGLIVFDLTYLFLEEGKELFKIDSRFNKFLMTSLIGLGFINALYHVGYAIYRLFI